MARPKAKQRREVATKRRATQPKRAKAKPKIKPKAKPEAKTEAKTRTEIKPKRPAARKRGAGSSGKVRKKKTARLDREPSGRKPATQAQTSAARGRVQGFPAAVKYRAAKIHAKPAPKGRRPRKLSKHPDAVRARRYRRERKAISEAIEIEQLERIERKRERDRERQRQKREKKRGIIGGGRPQKSERELAQGWLEVIRAHCARFSPASLDLAPSPGGATPWLIVGRFELIEGVNYTTLGAMLQEIADDVLLEASVHPSRLSQIRIIFSDPHSKRGEGDTTISGIAGWQYVVGDMIGEILGGGPGDEGALAVRYDETMIHTFYVLFSSSITQYETAFPAPRGGGGAPGSSGKRTQSIRLR